MKLAHLALVVSLALPTFASAQTWSARTKEAWNFYNNIATAKVGKLIECYGTWDLRDPPNSARVQCESLGLPMHHPMNSENINRYIHNGWEVVDRQVFPHFIEGKGYRFETEDRKRVLVRLKKVEPRKQYEDQALGLLDPVVRP